MNAQINRVEASTGSATRSRRSPGDAKDQVAVNAIMGHVDGTMAAVYRERIDPDRLRAAVEQVRRWLFDQDV
jgi:hypothetical protein